MSLTRTALLTSLRRQMPSTVPVIEHDSSQHDAPAVVVDVESVTFEAAERGRDPRNPNGVSSYEAVASIRIQCASSRAGSSGGITSMDIAGHVADAIDDLNTAPADPRGLRWVLRALGDSESQDTALNAPRQIDVVCEARGRVTGCGDLVQ